MENWTAHLESVTIRHFGRCIGEWRNEKWIRSGLDHVRCPMLIMGCVVLLACGWRGETPKHELVVIWWTAAPCMHPHESFASSFPLLFFIPAFLFSSLLCRSVCHFPHSKSHSHYSSLTLSHTQAHLFTQLHIHIHILLYSSRYHEANFQLGVCLGGSQLRCFPEPYGKYSVTRLGGRSMVWKFERKILLDHFHLPN